MNAFSLRVIASDKVFYEGRASIVIVPAVDGDLAIEAHHENAVIAMKIGTLRFKSAENDEWVEAVVGQGFAQIINNRVMVLVDTAERPEDIDEKRAEEALERAKEQLRQKQSEMEYYHTQASLARAMVRLKVKKNR